MTFKEDMADIIQHMIKKVELERFLMGKGKVEFAKILGMHYHTYNSFIKQDRVTHPKTGSIIANFLIERGVDIKELAERTDKLTEDIK